MNNEGTYINFWSLLEAYDSKKYDVIIEKLENKDKIKISVYKKWSREIFGFKISKLVLKTKWIIDSDDKNILDHISNPIFGSDKSVDCLEYMRYAEKGFNENPTGNHDLDILHCAVGISGESGEVLDLIKKQIFHGRPVSATEMVDELSDIQWYLFNLMRLYGISFSNVLRANKIKLDKRYPNGRTKNILIADKNKADEKREIKNGLKLDS
jgi:NTP pyrophosphatase (non-canonical NTP hydrolase)